MDLGEQRALYAAPSYRATDDEPWYHFLHGNVPGHQIDFMYMPEVPQGPLTRQHFAHLARLMKYIEPHTNAPYAFAIGNLSRDDTQHEPGHGGVALIFGLRIRGATDHVGRQDPPFSHGIAAIDRELDATALLAAAQGFYRRVLGALASAEWYRSYVRCAMEAPASVPDVLSGYVGGFRDLPSPSESSMAVKWVTGGAPQPERLVIVHDDDAEFPDIASCAARIAAVLYQSDVRWTVLSNGREADVPKGVSIRFVAESALGSADAALGARRLDEIPEDPAEIARQLFGASPAVKEKPVALGWRARYSEMADSPSSDGSVDAPRTTWEGPPPPAPRYRAERPNGPAPRGERESDVPARVSAPAGDLDEPTVAIEGRDLGPAIDVSEGEISVDRVSVDDEAVTVGAPLRRVSSPAAAPQSVNGVHLHGAPAPAEEAIPPSQASPTRDLAAHAPASDRGDRRASFDPLPSIDDEPSAERAPRRRDTVALSQDDVKKSLGPVLPFRPAATPARSAVQTEIPVAATYERDEASDSIPNFRQPAGMKWIWILLAVGVVGVVILGAYLAFATDSAPPAQGAAPTTPASGASAPPLEAAISPSAATAPSAREPTPAAPSASATAAPRGPATKKQSTKTTKPKSAFERNLPP